QLFRLHREPCASQEKLHWVSCAPASVSVSSALVNNQSTILNCKVETGGNDIISAPPDREVAARPTWVAGPPLGLRSAVRGVKAPTSSEWVPEVHSARAPGDAHGSGPCARRAHAGNLTPQAPAGCERGGARRAAGPRCPQAPPRGWRRGGRGWWRVLREGGAAARGGLWRPGCHTRGGSGGGGSGSGSCRRRRDGHGRAARAGAGCLPPSLARSPSCLLAGCGAGLSQRSQEGRRGAKDADKFPQQPQIPAQAEAAAQTGQESAPRRSARPERPRRGAPGPFALRGAAVRDPMRRAREGREIRSPGGERQRRRAVLQLLEAGIGRQEAAERT
ncbi:hypothetical protein GH733_011398, partial [Mirounga leonina]